MIAITGATGQLGQHVIEELLKTVPASQIVAIVRNGESRSVASARGVVRQADYTDEAAFTTALNGVDKLLLISSSEVGQRAVQHQNVINAAKAAGVKFIAYTSLLHADKSRWVCTLSTSKPKMPGGLRRALRPAAQRLVHRKLRQARRQRWNTACLWGRRRRQNCLCDPCGLRGGGSESDF